MSACISFGPLHARAFPRTARLAHSCCRRLSAVGLHPTMGERQLWHKTGTSETLSPFPPLLSAASIASGAGELLSPERACGYTEGRSSPTPLLFPCRHHASSFPRCLQLRDGRRRSLSLFYSFSGFQRVERSGSACDARRLQIRPPLALARAPRWSKVVSRVADPPEAGHGGV